MAAPDGGSNFQMVEVAYVKKRSIHLKLKGDTYWSKGRHSYRESLASQSSFGIMKNVILKLSAYWKVYFRYFISIFLMIMH